MSLINLVIEKQLMIKFYRFSIKFCPFSYV